MEPEKHSNPDISCPENDHKPGKSSEVDSTGIGRSYECNFCKHGFTNAQALGGHMNIHRKDVKAKAKAKLKPNEEYYQNLRYFPDQTDDDDQQQQQQKSYYRPVNYYQVYLPSSNLPSFETENNYLPVESSGEEDRRNNNVNYKEVEVDLELRLGHDRTFDD